MERRRARRRRRRETAICPWRVSRRPGPGSSGGGCSGGGGPGATEPMCSRRGRLSRRKEAPAAAAAKRRMRNARAKEPQLRLRRTWTKRNGEARNCGSPFSPKRSVRRILLLYKTCRLKICFLFPSLHTSDFCQKQKTYVRFPTNPTVLLTHWLCIHTASTSRTLHIQSTPPQAKPQH